MHTSTGSPTSYRHDSLSPSDPRHSLQSKAASAEKIIQRIQMVMDREARTKNTPINMFSLPYASPPPSKSPAHRRLRQKKQHQRNEDLQALTLSKRLSCPSSPDTIKRLVAAAPFHRVRLGTFDSSDMLQRAEEDAYVALNTWVPRNEAVWYDQFMRSMGVELGGEK
ncbi:MAG: hypothetical protein M1829_006031 [Trizodia sp. TS-e1964]|nr:MAG: hypothetical protein M1829_006031 [Trizodia sp. TS-e1964]